MVPLRFRAVRCEMLLQTRCITTDPMYTFTRERRRACPARVVHRQPTYVIRAFMLMERGLVQLWVHRPREGLLRLARARGDGCGEHGYHHQGLMAWTVTTLVAFQL